MPTSSRGQKRQAMTGLLSGRKPPTTSRSAGKNAKAGAGVAVLTAAAGVAFKNRDKLTSLLKGSGASTADVAPADQTPAAPAEATRSAPGAMSPASVEHASSETWRDEPPPMREQPG